MEEYYASFAEFIGLDENGKYTYIINFSDTPESVWGDDWNICPAGIVSDLKQDENTISKQYKLISEDVIYIATKNTCFSMQDCIDGIIALIFNEKFKIMFGESISDIKDRITKLGLEFTQIERKSEEIIDDLIDSLNDDEQS